ncbi:hypothetical protein DUNSADRAFT_13290, partial [Dunaliella salina]
LIAKKKGRFHGPLTKKGEGLMSLPGQRFFVLTDDALTYAKDAHSLGPAFGGLEKNEKEYTETPLCELQDVIQDKKDRKAFQ